jgi:hypothetical protein
MSFRAFETWAAAFGVVASASPEPQNGDYESGVALIGEDQWHIRTARNTPAKPGAFVAFWRRDTNGKTAPFETPELHAGLLVFVEQGDRRGMFMFTPDMLEQQGIASGRTAGKRGFRVYPAWCDGLNPQAAATQRVQAAAFREY